MIIECKGIKTDTYYIPPFVLKEGEIAVLFLSNGPKFYDLAVYIKDIVTGKRQDKNIIVTKPLTFVEHFFESSFKRLFFSMTVGKYLKKKANTNSPYASKIYDIERITDKTKMNTLTGSPAKLLSLYATLSHSQNIVFDLMAVDPQGAEKIYAIVKENVKNGGAALLLDNYNCMKDDCTVYIELQWL